MKDSKPINDNEPINILGIKPSKVMQTDSDSFNYINHNNSQGQKEHNSKDNLMPNPDDFDEGDDDDSEGKGSRTPGL